MRKIDRDGWLLTLTAWFIYVALAVGYVWVSSSGAPNDDPVQVDREFWSRVYVAYSFPLFVLSLWVLNGASQKPASTPWLLTLSASSFAVIFGAAHLLVAL